MGESADKDRAAATAWRIAVACYNGIEQSMAHILRTQCAASDTDLRRKYDRDLLAAFKSLPPADREYIETSHKEHTSLHSRGRKVALPATARGYVKHLSTMRQQYLSIGESDGIPPADIWAMTELWSAVCNCILRHDGVDVCTKFSSRLNLMFASYMEHELRESALCYDFDDPLAHYGLQVEFDRLSEHPGYIVAPHPRCNTNPVCHMSDGTARKGRDGVRC